MALACRQCRTRGSLGACCEKLTCTARSGLLSLANHWTACPITLPKTPNLCWRCLVFWLGSCSNSHLVDFQGVSTLRHSDLFGENILGNVATTCHRPNNRSSTCKHSIPAKTLDSGSKKTKRHTHPKRKISNRCSEGQWKLPRTTSSDCHSIHTTVNVFPGVVDGEDQEDRQMADEGKVCHLADSIPLIPKMLQ